MEAVKHDLTADAAGVAEVAERIRRTGRAAVDTEGDSLHNYHWRICLVQVRADGQTTLVDPVEGAPLEPLLEVLADPEVETLMHGGDYDVMCFSREFGARIGRLWDTQTAAQFLGMGQVGLATLLEEEFGVSMDKKHQKADWSERPLDDSRRTYAAADVHWLPELADRQRERLDALGRTAWVEEESDRIADLTWGEDDDPVTAALKIKGARDLDDTGRAILVEAWKAREKLASELDRPTFRVMGNGALESIARRRPTSRKDLESIKGIGRWTVRKLGDELLEAVRAGQSGEGVPLPKRPRGRRPSDDEKARVDRLRKWRKKAAAEYDLDSGTLIPRSDLEDIARENPSDPEELAAIESLSRWRVRELGPAILEALGG